MAGDENKDDGALISVSVGKETDRSVAAVISALLMPPAAEIGTIIGDSLGILADRIHQKRQFNAQIGFAEVRKKLDSAHVEPTDIVPPKAEDLHLLLNGLSLSDDASVRDLWAGLFAKVLEPDSKVTAERPFVAVLQSLTPLDAKIIDFLAYAIKTDSAFRLNARQFRPKDLTAVTPEEAQEMDQARAYNVTLQREAVQAINDRAVANGVDQLNGGGWSDNLLRQGLIERANNPASIIRSIPSSLFDQRDLERLIGDLKRQVENITAMVKENASPPQRVLGKGGRAKIGGAIVGAQIELEVQFTGFGRRFAQACGLL